MLGLCTGLLADGVVSDAEAALLHQWMRANPDVLQSWPGNVMSERLNRIFADGEIDGDERSELALLLRQLVGGQVGVAADMNLATALPFDDPAPSLAFANRSFVLTGMFAFGPRKECERAIHSRGGLCGSSITKKTHVVVVGTFASRDWVRTSHGTKILKAVEYRDRGSPIAIVGEDHWASQL